MPERETAAMGEELWWRERAMWLLLRRLGGEVDITAEEWAGVPERPELILDRDRVTRWGRTYDVMRWTAREPASPVAAEPAPPEKTRPWPYDGPEGRARLTGNTG